MQTDKYGRGKMKKIGIVLIGIIIICNVGVAWAEPTVKEIIQKWIDNNQKIQSMEADLINKWTKTENNQIIQNNGHIWSVGDQKLRVEAYDELGALLQTQIVNGNWTVIIDSHGTHYQTEYDTSTISNTDPGESKLIDEGGISKLLELYNITINIGKSNAVTGIYCLDIAPKAQSALKGAVEKYEEYIDYNKGVEVKKITYLVDYGEMVVNEQSDFININDVWVAQDFTNTVTIESGKKMINQIHYTNIKINEAIADDKFHIDSPGG
jgi:outer membrane lipoprotein-sorting protein